MIYKKNAYTRFAYISVIWFHILINIRVMYNCSTVYVQYMFHSFSLHNFSLDV